MVQERIIVAGDISTTTRDLHTTTPAASGQQHPPTLTPLLALGRSCIVRRGEFVRRARFGGHLLGRAKRPWRINATLRATNSADATVQRNRDSRSQAEPLYRF
ncbi:MULTISPECIES: hypothetical protein [Mycobacterium]|uniref:Uncharacterized protein n=1 Tax=Mycobacterium paragordonae TaxID=1389713 RepID=A0ABQ1CER5_9MYCO|nr:MULTISPECIES: hypothetical protein [Mycobacterium]RUP05521.1 MAG: hypothetical protein EKK34_08320 [Mycobacterium sp.]GFG82963.1 hypothetical protein MPRG_62390 [Mycobacterium paragordonae]